MGGCYLVVEFKWGWSRVFENRGRGAQLFQSSNLIMEIATYRLKQPRGQSSDNHMKCMPRWEVRDGVTITIFSSIGEMDTRPAIYKKTPP